MKLGKYVVCKTFSSGLRFAVRNFQKNFAHSGYTVDDFPWVGDDLLEGREAARRLNREEEGGVYGRQETLRLEAR